MWCRGMFWKHVKCHFSVFFIEPVCRFKNNFILILMTVLDSFYRVVPLLYDYLYCPSWPSGPASMHGGGRGRRVLGPHRVEYWGRRTVVEEWIRRSNDLSSSQETSKTKEEPKKLDMNSPNSEYFLSVKYPKLFI